MNVLPCPLCGYDARITGLPEAEPAAEAVALACPHCGLDSLDRSLQQPRANAFGGILIGLAAVPRGLYYLASTSRVKRWLIPPLLLTTGAFVALFWWFWNLLMPIFERLEAYQGTELPPLPEGWLERAGEWFLRSAVVAGLAQAGGVVVFIVVSSLAGLWAFSIVYEALAGPFLDEIHGRLERRWFGGNPRDSIQRPTELAPSRCALITSLAAVPALAALVAWWWLAGWQAWAALLLGVPLPFLIAAAVHREYGKWLFWVLRLEGGTLLVSVKAACIAGVVLVLFLPLKFVPILGYVLFGGAAGFTTALSLLDIPFSRRQWPLKARISFMFHQLPAMISFGVVSSLLFVIPIIGPVVMVPAASVGGLWMICRLDKAFLRRPRANSGGGLVRDAG